MGHGGKRAGAGKPPGTKHQSTIDKERAREAVRRLVIRRMRRLVAAQMANAEGLKYLVVRDKKTGKFIRVTEAMAKAREQGLGEQEEVIEVWEKDPSVQAFTDLMNRALDKPAEQEQSHSISGTLVIKWQDEA